MKRFAWVVLGVSLAACGDDDKKGGTGDATSATTATNDPDATTPNDVSEPETVEQTPPYANVYKVSPATTPETEQVELQHLTATDGTLTGSYANVRNCVPDDSAPSQTFDLGGFSLDVIPCTPKHTALPNEAGNYLDITPPASPEEDDGTFAEVQMYHHMQVIHDYFKSVHGLSNRDEPLDALTNVQAYINLCQQWAWLPNAAFIPHESLAQLGIDFGIPGDAIIFSGTPTKNFAFDASVIYHEYTHAILGATRLSGVFADEQGINNLPGALNEAYADYFAATLVGNPNIGEYSLNDLGNFEICGFALGGGGNQGRNLTNFRQCPEDLTAEVHADSEIYSSALWDIHEALGKVDADRIILAGVLELTQTSDFTAAADATIDAALDALGQTTADQVRAAFEERGIIACERVVPIAKVGARGIPVTLEPKDAFQPNPYPGYTPGYLQFSVVVPEGKHEVVLELTLEAGGLGGGGGGVPPIDLVAKLGTSAITYQFGLGAGSVTNDGVSIIAVEDSKVRIAGDCLSGQTIVFALHNKGDSISLTGVEATFADTMSGEATYACETK